MADEKPDDQEKAPERPSKFEGMALDPTVLHYVSKLERDNHRLRDKNRSLKGNVPADGSVVLTADEAKKRLLPEDLGDVADVRKRLQVGDAAVSTLAERDYDSVLEETAGILGYAPKTFKAVARGAGLKVVIEEAADGKGGKARTPFVVGADDKKVLASEVIAERFGDELPAPPADDDTPPAPRNPRSRHDDFLPGPDQQPEVNTPQSRAVRSLAGASRYARF